MIAYKRESLSPIKRQEQRKRIFQCMDKKGDIKVFKVERLIDIPIQWRKDPLFLGYAR